MPMPVTRGFTGKRRGEAAGRADRLPPGQYDVGREWPTLTAEVTPHLDPERWSVTVDGLVDDPDDVVLARAARPARRRRTSATSTA